MKKGVLIIGVLALTFGSAASCSSTKKVAETEDSKAKIIASEMKEKGYNSGIIIYSTKEGDCEYTIQVDTGATFDPINLADKFKNHREKVWFKYRGLRRANRCPNANPVEIEDMQKAL